jgi:hypothetical protein
MQGKGNVTSTCKSVKVNSFYCHKGRDLKYFSCIMFQMICQLSFVTNWFETFIACYLLQVDAIVTKN